MTTDQASRFLEAEEKASRLVEELAHLKAESDRLAGASTSLEETGQAVKVLANDLGVVATEMQAVTKTLVTIGTPEILSQIEAVHSDFRADLRSLRFMVLGLSVIGLVLFFVAVALALFG